jgi:hypothetical protein
VPTTAAEFRTVAPSFADPTMFPDEAIEFWLGASTLFLTCRWGSAIGVATVLWTEHNMALQAWQTNSAAGGVVPGMGPSGLVSDESVAAVRVSYDTQTGSEADAGHWNLTLYGRMFIRLARMFGAGPWQLNVPDPIYGMGLGLWSGSGFGPGAVGPGWWRNPQENVPVRKFLPTTVRAPIGAGGPII